MYDEEHDKVTKILPIIISLVFHPLEQPLNDPVQASCPGLTPFQITWIALTDTILGPKMVKKGPSKGGKPGNGQGAKNPSVTADDSFIVFSNSDKDPKPKKAAGASSAEPSGQNGPALAGEGHPRPNVKQIIGGASWTGKLPVNLLSEHCQKQRWEKPEYTMVYHPDFRCSICILTCTE